MKEKSAIQVVEGIKFSFIVSKSIASMVIACAMKSDLEVSYKGFGNVGSEVQIKGIGRAENVVSLMENINEILPSKVDTLNFINSFKYKVTQFAEPCIIPFVSEVKESVSNSKKS